MIHLTFDKKELEALTEKLCRVSPKDRLSVTKEGLRDVALEAEKQLKMNIKNSILKVRSGRLYSSMGISKIVEQGDNIIVDIGSGVRQGNRVPYADIHETGGVITPKNTKYLAIPLSAALTRAGVLRKKPRDWEGTFVLRSKNGALIIAQKKNKRGSINALFILKKSVTIPGRRYMSITRNQVEEKKMPIMIARIEKHLSEKK